MESNRTVRSAHVCTVPSKLSTNKVSEMLGLTAKWLFTLKTHQGFALGRIFSLIALKIGSLLMLVGLIVMMVGFGKVMMVRNA